MVKPDKMTLKQGWGALREARKGNQLSKCIYERFAECNALPLLDEPECQELSSYDKFVQYHTQVWSLD